VRQSPWLSLFGAYALLDDPGSSKPLVVHIYGMTGPSSLLRGVACFVAKVHAEDLAVSAAATACVIRRDGGVELRVTFPDLRGGTTDIVVRRRRTRSLARSLTELSGHVLGSGGTVVATARLRFNWRVR